MKQRSQLCVSFLDQSEIIQQDTPTKKICSYLFPCGNSHTIVNHKICQTIQREFNFGSASRSSKSSPRRVPCETRAALEVSSDRSAERDSSMNFLTRS